MTMILAFLRIRHRNILFENFGNYNEYEIKIKTVLSNKFPLLYIYHEKKSLKAILKALFCENTFGLITL